MQLTLAGESWPIEAAAAVCRWYAAEFHETLCYYDFAGVDRTPYPHDTVDLSDGGRLVVINARLRADDIPRMIRAAESAPWDAVPHHADLIRSDGADVLLEAERLYRHFRSPGVGLGPTRTHKLLHLKRPAVFPIVDRVVREAYWEPAKRAGRARGSNDPHFWPVLADEIRANAAGYAALTDALAGNPAARLTVPRLADILTWSLHGRRQNDARSAAARAA